MAGNSARDVEAADAVNRWSLSNGSQPRSIGCFYIYKFNLESPCILIKTKKGTVCLAASALPPALIQFRSLMPTQQRRGAFL